jgi:hypothetical protein
LAFHFILSIGFLAMFLFFLSGSSRDHKV